MKKHTIELNDEQLELTRRALELYTRISLGQFTSIVDLNKTVQNHKPDYDENKVMRDYLSLAATELTGYDSPNASWGIFNTNVDNDARLANHLQQSIKHYKYLQTPPEERAFNTTASSKADFIKDLEITIKEVE